MKKIIITVFLHYFFISYSQSKTVNPKIIENWINQNFANSRTPFNNGTYFFIAFSSINNGVLNQNNTTRYLDPKYSFMDETKKMTLNLKDLYYDSVTYELREGQYYINAKCINNVICSLSIDENGKKNGSENPLLGMIAKNKVDIEKCKEAFSKLIKHYGGKKQYNW